MGLMRKGAQAMRIEDALDRFLLQLVANGRSQHTIDQYRRHMLLLAHWAAQAGHCRDLRALDHEDLARFLVSPQALTRPDGRPKKATSVNALRSSLRGFFQYLHWAGYIDTDPSLLIRRAMCGPPPPRTLSATDQDRLLSTLAQAVGRAAERDHALFHLLLGTGIRISAALALLAEDVDLERGEILLRHSEGDREERIFLPPVVRDHLRQYLAGRRQGPVFTRQGGHPITTRHAQRRLRHWIQVSGVSPATPHTLRHTFATSLYRRTRDLLLVRRALGHKSITSTLRYASVADDDLREAMGASA